MGQWRWGDYSAPDGTWRIAYPTNVYTPLDMGSGLVIFISQDRGHFVGVDSRSGAAGIAAMQARAAEALAQIYTQRPAQIAPLAQTDFPWQAGVTFTTAKGSTGTAVYQVDASAGAPITYGLIYGFKPDGPTDLREGLYQMAAQLELTPGRGGAPRPQDPDPGTTAVAGLLSGWMGGQDVRPYLGHELRAQADAGRPLDQLLGLHPVELVNYSISAPAQTPERDGQYVIPAVLDYRGFNEIRYFVVGLEGHEWKILGTMSADWNAG